MPPQLSKTDQYLAEHQGLGIAEIRAARSEFSERLRVQRLQHLDEAPEPLLDLSRYKEGTILWAEQQIPMLVSNSALIQQKEGIALAESLAQVLDQHDPAMLDPFSNWARQNCHGLLLIMSDQFEEASVRLTSALELAKEHSKAEWYSIALINLAKVHIGTGDVLAGARMLAQIDQIGYSDQHSSMALSELADLFDHHNQPAHAVAYRRAALERCEAERASDRLWVAAPLVLNLVEAGLYKEAAQGLTDLKEGAEQTGLEIFRAISTYLDAFLALRQGQPKRALELLDVAQKVRLSPDHSMNSICTPAIVAEVLLANSQPDQALKVILAELNRSKSGSSYKLLRPLGAEAAEELGDWQLVTRFRQEILEELTERHGNSRALIEMNQARLDAAGVAELNHELVTIREQLIQTRSEREDILDIVSHDVMSPLTTLRLLMHQISQHPPSPAMTRGVERTFKRLDSILWQLCLLDPDNPVRTSSGSMRLCDLVSASAEEFHWLAAEKNIDLTLVKAVGSEDAAVEQPGILRHIVDNLVSNAIKFSEPGKSVSLSTVFSTTADSGTWDIVVSDEGPGLHEQDLARIFTKFGRLSSKPTSDEPTTGLGLYIANKLAQSIGADLSAQSDGKGKGSRFLLRLPIRAAAST